MERRTAIASLAAWLAMPGAGHATTRLARADARIKAQPIRWPSGDGGMLHGFMAIPARAKGRQPAVLVLAEPGGPPGLGSSLAAAIAQAGLIACAPDAAMVAAAAADQAPRALRDLEATIGWLGHNDYATGAVGLLGTQRTNALLGRLAATSGVSATVILGAEVRLTATGTTPTILALPAADSAEWANSWPRAMAYLREHLQ
jgi:dienelactone hydrolase